MQRLYPFIILLFFIGGIISINAQEILLGERMLEVNKAGDQLKYVEMGYEEWRSEMQISSEEKEESFYGLTFFTEETKITQKCIYNPDSIITMIQGVAEIEFNRYSWMREDDLYINSIIASNGCEVIFSDLKTIVGYLPEEKVLLLGSGGPFRYAIDIQTGQDVYLPQDVFASDNGKWRVVKKYNRGGQSKSYLLQKYDTAYIDFCLLSVVCSGTYPQFYGFKWVENQLYIMYGDYYDKRLYGKFLFEP